MHFLFQLQLTMGHQSQCCQVKNVSPNSVYVSYITMLKGTLSKNISWPENVENVQIYPFAGFTWLIHQCYKTEALFFWLQI